MSRPLRIEYPHAVYHVTARGNARQAIVLDDDDRTALLDVLAGVVERYGWLVHAYCLMDNHYHLLIETPDANLGRGMRQLNGVFTQRFNRRHGRVGHLFQGRYKAILVDRQAYLLELCRYVVLNPVRARMVRAAREWRWSSYRATAGMTTAPTFLTTDWVLQQFGLGRREAAAAYRRFVAEGRGAGSPWQAVRGQVLLGGLGFLERMRPRLDSVGASREVPGFQRRAARPPLAALFKGLSSCRTDRDARIVEAVAVHGHPQSAVARHLGLHPSTVSRVANGGNARCKT